MGIDGVIYAIELLLPIVCIVIPIVLMALNTNGQEYWDDWEHWEDEDDYGIKSHSHLFL